jgi:hypothetical protein
MGGSITSDASVEKGARCPIWDPRFTNPSRDPTKPVPFGVRLHLPMIARSDPSTPLRFQLLQNFREHLLPFIRYDLGFRNKLIFGVANLQIETTGALIYQIRGCTIVRDNPPSGVVG